MSLFDNTYRTIAAPAEGIYKDKGSKFIAYAYPVKDEEQVKKWISALKSEHPKARHHCWAFRLTPDRSVFRLNDDGEPSGTAGRPILNTLLSCDITNVVVVVVRYFGGTLLGVPGLIKAYKMATQAAVNAAVVLEKTVNDVYTLRFGYVQLNQVMRVIKENDLTITNQVFDNECLMTLEIRKGQLNAALEQLNTVEGIKITYIRTL